MAVSDSSDSSVSCLLFLKMNSQLKHVKVVIDETLKVAELMGMKTVLNEFIAYQHLSQLIATNQLVGKRAIMMVRYLKQVFRDGDLMLKISFLLILTREKTKLLFIEVF